MILSTTNAELSRYLGDSAGQCVFVPTMGALHAGHASLVAQGVDLAKRRNLPGGCVVSIFVNPTQFNDPADLARYPRTLAADLRVCDAAGAACVFAPSVEDIYPPHVVAEKDVTLPAVATSPGLEDAARPGHFLGVWKVVRRLFELVKPDAALFGEKDWQQLRLIEALVDTHSLPIEIIGVPTVRDADGLAMSSRNVFLSPADRTVALAIPAALQAANGCHTIPTAEWKMRTMLEAVGLHVEYAVVRHARTLMPVAFEADGILTEPNSYRSIIAARVGGPAGGLRLIDNAAWTGVSDLVAAARTGNLA